MGEESLTIGALKSYQSSGSSGKFFGILVCCPCQKLANLFSLFPLIRQPLMDNLESQTYEVFEKDPIKYSQYQQV